MAADKIFGRLITQQSSVTGKRTLFCLLQNIQIYHATENTGLFKDESDVVTYRVQGIALVYRVLVVGLQLIKCYDLK